MIKFFLKHIIKAFYKWGYQKNPKVGKDYDIIYLYLDQWNESLVEAGFTHEDVLMTIKVKCGVFKDFVVSYIYNEKEGIIDQYLLSFYPTILDAFEKEFIQFTKMVINLENLKTQKDKE